MDLSLSVSLEISEERIQGTYILIFTGFWERKKKTSFLQGKEFLKVNIRATARIKMSRTLIVTTLARSIHAPCYKHNTKNHKPFL